jgi:FAD/FMN-containing dehydrogenase
VGEKELAKIVGSRNVLSKTGILEKYSTDASFVTPVRPRYVVRPESAAEVQAIVKWANDSRTPLVPISSGGSHYRGDTVPGVEGAVIVDLSRMKKIIRIDPRNKVAMVEPGVTFGELKEALEKEGLDSYMPLAPRRSKSVIGSVLEREPVTMPAHHWDSADPLLCVEVIFGTGDRFRTGEASGPDTVEEQWEMGRVQMNPFGHSHVDFHRLIAGSQGTIGIVIWATLKCRYLSKVSRALLVPSDKLEPLIDLIYKPLKFRLGGQLFILNGLNLACLLGKNPHEIRELKKALPPWVLFISFEGYGVLPEEKIAYEEADFRSMAESCGLKPQETLSGTTAQDAAGLFSRPSPDPYWKTILRGGFQDIFFLTTLDKTPEFAAAMTRLAPEHDFPAENMGVYIQPIVQGTSCHCEFNMYYNPAAAREMDSVEEFMGMAGEAMAELGAFFSRPYGAWRDAAYRHAAGTAAMQKKIKEIFDPNGILNPGKLCF